MADKDTGASWSGILLPSKGMNLLAHLFLTRNADPDRMVGNFIADRVKGKAYQKHPPEVARGIILHRMIDSYTDDHPRTRQSKELLHPYHGKWAGVVIDILNDHFLATDWERYHPYEKLEDFAKRMHRVLGKKRERMSEQDHWILDRMIRDQWLLGYREKEGIRRAFYGLSERTGEKGFLTAMDTLEDLESPLREHFNAFFPDLIGKVEHALEHETDEIGPPSDR